AKATANGGIVECAKNGSEAACASRGQGCYDQRLCAARIHAITERTYDAHDFVVAVSWIERRLDHEVWRFVSCIAGGIDEVVQAAARTGRVEKEVVVGAAAAERGLRTLDAQADREFIPVLRDAEPVRALPSPSHDVLRIDLQRELLLAILD